MTTKFGLKKLATSIYHMVKIFFNILFWTI